MNGHPLKRSVFECLREGAASDEVWATISFVNLCHLYPAISRKSYQRWCRQWGIGKGDPSIKAVTKAEQGAEEAVS